MADFKVNGKEIDLPDMGTFSIDEAIVLYEYSGMTLDQAEEIEGLHPGIIGGLVHIAIARAEPERKAKEIEKAVRAMNLLDLLTSIPDEEEGEKEDLAPGSETSSSSSAKSSGPDSVPSSDLSLVPSQPSDTGTPESDSSQLPRTELVV
jgi:hypothetical protein